MLSTICSLALAKPLQQAARTFASAAGAQPTGSSADTHCINSEAFACAAIPCNQLPQKPRSTGLTEIRAAYYTPCTPTYLREVLEGVGHAVDGIKFAGGSFRVMSRKSVCELIKVAHEHNAYVSTGGWIEYVLTKGPGAVKDYLAEVKGLGFDVVELSAGFITLPDEDLHRLIRDVHNAGMQAKPEVGIQFGAGGASGAAALRNSGQADPEWAITRAARCFEQGVPHVMIESEGITEDVDEWQEAVAARFVKALGLDRLMFEASDPAVFSYYVQSYGPRVNLFVDHSQIVQLECLRRGIWGTSGTWGRILTHGN